MLVGVVLIASIATDRKSSKKIESVTPKLHTTKSYTIIADQNLKSKSPKRNFLPPPTRT